MRFTSFTGPKNPTKHGKNAKVAKSTRVCPPTLTEFFREIPPGLLQHVLTVLVFWTWLLLLPRLPPSSRSLRLFPWASILLYGPLDITWICCPQLPHHPSKSGTRSTCFYSTGGHTPSSGANSVSSAKNSASSLWLRGRRGTSGEVWGTSGEVWEASGEPLDCCLVPQ